EFTVLKRIDKVHDTVDRTGLRRMDNAVILVGVLCSGAAHDGCQARCQTIWKEAWLQKIDARRNGSKSNTSPRPVATTAPQLVQLTRREITPGEVRYTCQATELKRASAYLTWWDPRQYVKDVRSGNVGFFELMRGFLYWIFEAFIVGRMRGGTHLVPIYNAIQRWRGGEQLYLREGTLTKTPTEELL